MVDNHKSSILFRNVQKVCFFLHPKPPHTNEKEFTNLSCEKSNLSLNTLLSFKLWVWEKDSYFCRICCFLPFNKHFSPGRSRPLNRCSYRTFTNNVQWKKRTENKSWDGNGSWKAVGLFETSSKRGSGQMACTVWRLASVNDQAEAQKGQKKESETSFSVTQSKLSHLHKRQNQQDPGLRFEPSIHTLFEMSGWLIVFQWTELGLYAQPAALIHQPTSICTYNLPDRGSSFTTHWATVLIDSWSCWYGLNWLERAI